MGFKLPKRTLRLKFEGTAYEGAEVVLNLNVKLGYYFDAVAAKESGDAESMFAFVADMVVEWNLEDDDGPIPVGMAGLRRVDDLGFVTELMAQWEHVVKAEVDVSPLSKAPSNGAVTSAAAI